MFKVLISIIFLFNSLYVSASGFNEDQVSFLDFESELQVLEASQAAQEETAMKQVEAINTTESDNISDTISTSQAAPIHNEIAPVPDEVRIRRVRSR